MTLICLCIAGHVDLALAVMDMQRRPRVPVPSRQPRVALVAHRRRATLATHKCSVTPFKVWECASLIVLRTWIASSSWVKRTVNHLLSHLVLVPCGIHRFCTQARHSQRSGEPVQVVHAELRTRGPLPRKRFRAVTSGTVLHRTSTLPSLPLSEVWQAYMIVWRQVAHPD